MNREIVHGRTDVEFPQLELVRPDLEQLPPLVVPAGYELRSYRPGDEVAWGEIMSRAFNPFWNVDAFRILIRPHFGFRPERVIFACSGGRPVASACAFRWSGLPPSQGYVHMVGALEEHCGRGLGRALALACLQRFREEGFTSAMLQTESFRLPAIKHYLRLGFRPVLVREDHRGKWKTVLQRLGWGGQMGDYRLDELSVMSDRAYYVRTLRIFSYLYWLQATGWMR